MNNVTANHLICHGKDELYKWDDVCRYNDEYEYEYEYYADSSIACQLKDGDILQLDPS